MPLPTPPNSHSKEKKEKFMQKCFHALRNENKPQSQKAAICLSIYERSKKKKETKGSNESPTWEDDVQMNGFFII